MNGTSHMRHSRRGAAFLLGCVCLLSVLFTACTMTKSYIYQVETGDNIRVVLQTGDGYTLEDSNGTFVVSHNDDIVLQGMFADAGIYARYMEIMGTEGVTLLATDKTSEGHDYLFYEYADGNAGTEDNYIMVFAESDTGAVIASLSGQEEAKAAFARLSFVVEE